MKKSFFNRNRKRKVTALLSSFLILLTSVPRAYSADLIHHYELDGDFTDSLGNGVDITSFNTATSSFVSEGGWTWTANANPGAGLVLDTEITDPTSYSLGFRIEYDRLQGDGTSWAKIISFREPADDNGMYFKTGAQSNLQLYVGGGGVSVASFSTNTFYDFVFTRASDNKLTVYVVEQDSTLTKVYEVDDPGTDAQPNLVGGKYQFRLFMDDTSTSSEWTDGGTVSFIKVWNGVLGQSEILAALDHIMINVLGSSQALQNSPAYAAATIIDNTPALLQLFTDAGLTADSDVSNEASQTLPLLTGGASLATAGTTNAIGRVIQSRIAGNLGLSSGDEPAGEETVWVKPFGSWAHRDDDGTISGYDAQTAGLILGLDKVFTNKIRMGLAWACANTEIESNSYIAPQSADTNINQLIYYGSYNIDDRTDLNFQLDYGWNTNEGKRTIAFTNSIASSEYASQTVHAGLGIGRVYELNEKTNITPYSRVDYIHIENDDYTETGAGLLNLSVGGQSTNLLTLGLGGKLSQTLNDAATLTVDLGVSNQIINEDTMITAAFQGAPASSFDTKGLSPEKWIGNTGLGLVYQIGPQGEITAKYDADISEEYINQTVSVKFRWIF